MNLTDLKRNPMSSLLDLARERPIVNRTALRKAELVLALAKDELGRGHDVTARGVLEVHPGGWGYLRAPEYGFAASPDDAYVLPSQIRKLHLREGDEVEGLVRSPREKESHLVMRTLEVLTAAHPAAAPHTEADTAEPPTSESRALSRLRVEHDGGAITARLVDLMSPLARGGRCLIEAPAHPGRLSPLRELATGAASQPSTTVVTALLDAHADELAEARRGKLGEVVAARADQPADQRARFVALALARCERLAESGAHAVLVLDSLTRLGLPVPAPSASRTRKPRAAEPQRPPQPPTHDLGAQDEAGLSLARRIWNAARTTSAGGSLTVVATVLEHDPCGEEFEATADTLVRIDRALLERRVAPPLDLRRTRSHAVLEGLDEKEAGRAALLRSLVETMSPSEASAWLGDKLRGTGSNAELLETMNR
jgi:transcription termination factor Rho